jgi:hypothetical protein
MIHKTSILAAVIVLLPIGLAGGDAFCDSPNLPTWRPAQRPARAVYCVEELGSLRADLPLLTTLEWPEHAPVTVKVPAQSPVRSCGE